MRVCRGSSACLTGKDSGRSSKCLQQLVCPIEAAAPKGEPRAVECPGQIHSPGAVLSLSLGSALSEQQE